MNRIYFAAGIWLALAASALIGLSLAAPALLAMIVGWFGGVVSAILVYEIYRYLHPVDEVVIVPSVPL